jgi:hypothetical protein
MQTSPNGQERTLAPNGPAKGWILIMVDLYNNEILVYPWIRFNYRES